MDFNSILGYLVIQTRNNKVLTEEDVNYFIQAASNAFNFEGAFVNQWLSPRRDKLFIFWSREISNFFEKISSNKFHFFNGYLRYHKKYWFSSELYEFNQAFPSLENYRLDFGGVFSLLSIEPGLISIQTSISNLCPCYVSQNHQYIIFSSKAMVANLLANGDFSPTVDLSKLGALVACRWLAHLNTPYDNVQRLPLDSLTIATASGLKPSQSLSELVFDGSPGEIALDTIELISQELVNSVAALPREYVPNDFGITGGRDSRLLLAALKQTGLVESLYTIGSPNHPDCIIGTKVAQTLGLSHCVKGSFEASLPHLNRLRSACIKRLFQIDLQRDSWNPTFGDSYNPTITMDGYGGELWRGGFLKGKNFGSNIRQHTSEQFEHFFFRFDDILTKKSRSDYQEYLYHNYTSRIENCIFPGSLLDECYLKLRCGVWAAANAITISSSYRIIPLCDNHLLRLIYTHTNTAQRSDDTLVKAITNNLEPSLSSIPTLSEIKNIKQEKFDLISDNTELLNIVVNHRNLDMKSGVNYWKYAAPTILNREFQEVIFSREASEGGLWTIVCYNQLKMLYESSQIYLNSRIKQLWIIYSLALVCSGEWLSCYVPDSRHLPSSSLSLKINWAKAKYKLIQKLSDLVTQNQNYNTQKIVNIFEKVKKSLEIEDQDWLYFLDSIQVEITDKKIN